MKTILDNFNKYKSTIIFILVLLIFFRTCSTDNKVMRLELVNKTQAIALDSLNRRVLTDEKLKATIGELLMKMENKSVTIINNKTIKTGATQK